MISHVLRNLWVAFGFAAMLLAIASASAKTASTKPGAAKPAPSNVVRPAPDFAWIGAGGKPFALKTLRGQPVVILVAPSPDSHPLRQQVGRIESLYLGFSSKKAVFIAAFTAQPRRVASNVPYAIAQNGAAVAAAFGVNGSEFAVIVIGPDGNVDMVSQKVEGAQRILDIINNTYQNQAPVRAALGN